MEKIIVDRTALVQVLVALNGPGHLIRELQCTRGPIVGDNNPINQLIADLERPDVSLVSLKRYEEIQHINEALLSNVYRLREEGNSISIGLGFSLCHGDGEVRRKDIKKLRDRMDRLVAETPEQSLATIQSAQLRRTAGKYDTVASDSVDVDQLRSDADQIDKESGL
jgi:hypothetical protein